VYTCNNCEESRTLEGFLDNHRCNGPFEDSIKSRLNAWDRLFDHPFFRECLRSPKPMIDAMIDKLDSIMEDD